MALTNEILKQLKAPFEIQEHDLRDGGRDGKLVYITEEPLIERLNAIDPNWELRISPPIITNYDMTRPDSATVAAELTLCGVTRGGVGCGVANMKRGEYDKELRKWVEYETPIIYPLSETEIKGADTDALKRCARKFGIGTYLLRLKDVKISNEAGFAAWYKREFNAPRQDPNRTAPDIADIINANEDHLTPDELDELDAVTWTRLETAKDRLAKLRNKASAYWANETGQDMNYKHVCSRIAIIIGSEQRPTSFPAFCDMMRDDCQLSPGEVWDGVEAYKSEKEKASEG